MLDLDSNINPHELGLSKQRFWSSGDRLPVKRVIARVLTDPNQYDLVLLLEQFGQQAVLETWEQLRERGEVAKLVEPITHHLLENSIKAIRNKA